jgi:azurin
MNFTIPLYLVPKRASNYPVRRDGNETRSEGQQKNYIPETEKILFHTNLLQPNTSEAIYIIAPKKAGDYTYECSVPGHFYSMQGIMKVVE